MWSEPFDAKLMFDVRICVFLEKILQVLDESNLNRYANPRQSGRDCIRSIFKGHDVCWEIFLIGDDNSYWVRDWSSCLFTERRQLALRHDDDTPSGTCAPAGPRPRPTHHWAVRSNPSAPLRGPWWQCPLSVRHTSLTGRPCYTVVAVDKRSIQIDPISETN